LAGQLLKQVAGRDRNFAKWLLGIAGFPVRETVARFRKFLLVEKIEAGARSAVVKDGEKVWRPSPRRERRLRSSLPAEIYEARDSFADWESRNPQQPFGEVASRPATV